MDLVPVRRQNVSDGVFQQLLTQILEGDIRELPSERELAATLQVNRHAIREALKRLEQIGLVRIVHGGPTEVLNLREHAGLDVLAYIATGPLERVSPTLIRSVFEFRHAIGVDAARLAARRADPGTVEALRAAAGRYREPLSRNDLVFVDRAFWTRVVDASDNLPYRLSFNTLIKALDQMPEALEHVLGPEIDDPDGHDALVRAVADGDEGKAAFEAGRLLALSATVVATMLRG
ncbi:HTH-type transcriptional regulator Mce2R [Nocardia cerradoensis]|uniref:HTH-type transcriptional regulator Mce2R n=1 Tax=Nocardia cerradoensis TaxID=85688 RepID=A0A231H7F2_9NOCA|nr:FCD domain-containing protein [Nocardia cerradoensis]OXR44953.1 HTH-type transcriptional regulator Mce2R [Nocardia cerradoensis]